MSCKQTNWCSTHNGFAVAGDGLLVLAAEKQTVALLLELQSGGAFLGAARHLLQRLCGGRSPLLTDPVPRLFGEHRPVPETQIPAWSKPVTAGTQHTHTHTSTSETQLTLNKTHYISGLQ